MPIENTYTVYCDGCGEPINFDETFYPVYLRDETCAGVLLYFHCYSHIHAWVDAKTTEYEEKIRVAQEEKAAAEALVEE